MNYKRFARALFLVLMMLVAMTTAAQFVVVSTTNHLRLRTGPSTKYPMLVWSSTGKPVHINKGESLTYLGNNDTPDFYNVSFDGKSVYVSKQYSLLVNTIPGPPIPPPNVIHGPVVVVNGVSVRLRWGPSLDASVFTNGQGKPIYPSKGSQLTYLGESGNWYKVRYKGNELYISKSYSYLR